MDYNQPIMVLHTIDTVINIRTSERDDLLSRLDNLRRLILDQTVCIIREQREEGIQFKIIARI